MLRRKLLSAAFVGSPELRIPDGCLPRSVEATWQRALWLRPSLRDLGIVFLADLDDVEHGAVGQVLQQGVVTGYVMARQGTYASRISGSCPDRFRVRSVAL